MRLKRFRAILCIALLAAAAPWAHAADTSGRKLYKWVDEHGETHYGDRIPPEYASQEQHIVNSLGIETSRIEAQRTPEQLAAEEQKKLEAEQAAMRDRNLLNTYGSVAEIERLRDQRLALVADQIKVKGQFLEILNGQLEKLRIRWPKIWCGPATTSTRRKTIFCRSAARSRPCTSNSTATSRASRN
jgi:hypothetical protein